MKQPVIKISKKGKDINSTDIGDFLLHTRYNNLKVFDIASGVTTFTAHSQVTKYEYHHGLGYKPIVFGFFTGAYGRGTDTRATEDQWYMMNVGEVGYWDNRVLAGWEYNNIASSGTPSGAGGSNDSVQDVTLIHYHYADLSAGTDYLPVTSKYKLYIFAEPENGAWY